MQRQMGQCVYISFLASTALDLSYNESPELNFLEKMQSD